MKYCEAKQGRIFVLRLEDGDIVHETIEKFAVDKKITAAQLIILGGADHGSELIVGPKSDREVPTVPLNLHLDGAHEVSGTGTIFPDEEGRPLLHMHMACGRNEKTQTGCIRNGVRVWHIMEVVVIELIEINWQRKFHQETGFKFLSP